MKLLDVIVQIKEILDIKNINNSGIEELENMVLDLNIEDSLIPINKETIDRWIEENI